MTSLLKLDSVNSSESFICSVSSLPLVLGRDELAGIRLTNVLASRRHCEVFHEGDALWIRDLNSMNGTLVNEEPIHERHLRTGDEVRIGLTTFRVTIEREPESAMVSM